MGATKCLQEAIKIIMCYHWTHMQSICRESDFMALATVNVRFGRQAHTTRDPANISIILSLEAWVPIINNCDNNNH